MARQPALALHSLRALVQGHLVSHYSFAEETFNAITHGVGALASVAAGAVLITLASLYGDAWQITSAAIFVATLILLYSASTLYHAIPHETAKKRLKIFDHCAIYLLIAGTYTPFTLVSLRDDWGWLLFGLIWTLAISGVVFKLFFTGRFKLLSTLLYIGMGWLAVVAAKPLLEALSSATLNWLVAGGLAYTVGCVFYLSKRLPFSHGIWHLFVLTGSVCHFAAVLLTVTA